MYDREVKQLMEMGLPKSRALAALKACKGDAMGAAARAFNGDFDDVPGDDDDESDDGEVEWVSGGPSHAPSKSGVIDVDANSDLEMSDSEGHNEVAQAQSYDQDDDDDEEDFAHADDDDGVYEPAVLSDVGESQEEPNGVNGADPWAGVFTAKDRTIEIIDVQEPVKKVSIVVAPGSSSSAAKGSSSTKKVVCEVMTRSQWMSGCPEGGEQGHLFQIYNMLTSEPMHCASNEADDKDTAEGKRCKWTCERKPEQLFAVFDDFGDTLAHLRSILPQKCPKCGTVTCLACGQATMTGTSKKSSLEPFSPSDPLLHCSNIQPVVLGLGLFALQKQFHQASNLNDDGKKTAKESQKRKKPSHPTYLDDDWSEDDEPIDYGFAAGGSLVGGKANNGKPKGVGYGGQGHEDRSWQEKSAKLQQAKDEKMTTLLKLVRPAIPSHWRESGEAVSDVMLRRRFGEIATSLLRNDALHEHADRAELYLEVQEWLITIARHESLAAMLAMPHMYPASVKTRKANGVTETVTTYESSASVRELLENVKVQCISYIAARTAEEKRMAKLDENDRAEGKEVSERKDAESQKVLEYATTVISSLKAIDEALQEAKGSSFMRRLKQVLHPSASGDIDSQASDTELQEAYVNWAKNNSLDYVDLRSEIPAGTSKDKVTYRHVFTQSITATKSALPKRSATISKELATLKLHLPSSWGSSVFLRVDEERIDVMKALIIGPESTPYMNTPLIFDIFLPYDYNHSPPLCKIISTYGGRYRLNPNLYAEGKVCLSLLGTWSGPGWQSGKSTLLQVLLSIQSLILVAEPIANEPGHEGQIGTPSSNSYNANVRRMCVKLMLETIKSPPFPFEDIVKTHFKLKGRAILKQLDDWEKEDDGKTTCGDSMSAIHGRTSTKSTTSTEPSDAFKKDLDELRALLATTNEQKGR